MKHFKVWQPDKGETEDNAALVEASDAGFAAEGWADRHDWSSVEFAIVGGEPADVVVLDLKTGERTEWTVSGRTVRLYTARERTSYLPVLVKCVCCNGSGHTGENVCPRCEGAGKHDLAKIRKALDDEGRS